MTNLPYHSGVLEQSFDAIIIGSGLGGLTTAALLSKEKKKVLVLERHYEPGGFTHTFKRKRFVFDVGLHYVGQVHDSETVIKKAFDYITDFGLKWEPMDDIYDTAIIEGNRYDFVKGKENQIKQLIRYFPDEEKAIITFFQLMDEVISSTAMYFGERAMPFTWSKFIGFLLRKKFNRYSDQTTWDVLNKLTQNRKLIAVLCAQCGNYGLTPKKSSFAIHAIVFQHYINGGSYPVGGSAAIYMHIRKVIEASGGAVFIRASVQSIILENNKAVGVRMENGDEIRAPLIISNAGARNTYTKLISPDKVYNMPIHKDLEQVRASTSHMCLYIGLNGSDEELQLPKNNFWCYNNFDFDNAFEVHTKDPSTDPPLVYISFPSAKDPEWSAKNPGRSTIQLLAMGSYDWVKKWEESRWMKRGAAYEGFKEDFKQRLLSKLFEIVPQAKGRIEYCEFSTPLSTKHFSNYGSGEIYGLEHTPERFRLKWLRPHTPFKNLFLTGQDILTVGIGGALFSGIITASTIMKKNFLSRINKL